MNHFRYRPAGVNGWLAAATERQLLVIHPSASATGVAIYETSLGLGFQATLDELTRSGLSATPPFALLEWSDGASTPSLRVIVRGAVSVVVTAAGGQHTLDGAGVSTWTEQSFAEVTEFEITAETAESASPVGDLWLPLERGTALVTQITAAPVPHSAAPSPASTPATAPVPAPGDSALVATGDVSEATMVDRPAGLVGQTTADLDPDVRPGDDGYDYLFGETMYRSVSSAAVREPEPDTELPAEADKPGDHDGMTIMTGDLKKLRGNRKEATPPPAPAEPTPTLYLELSTGSRETLSQPVVVGRAPTASKVSGGALPRLVAIPGDKDISRNHAQFAVEGGTVVVTDLHSRNGTQVIMPGRPPQQLRQGEPTAVIVGTIIDLGGGVTLTVHEE